MFRYNLDMQQEKNQTRGGTQMKICWNGTKHLMQVDSSGEGLDDGEEVGDFLADGKRALFSE